jgi:hypothetical protein
MAMTDKISCPTHGERQAAYVCTHLLGDSAGLGFNRIDPGEANPFPDAWCDDCELIRAAHGEWNDESQKLVKISLLCSACYERSRIRNTRTALTLDDLADLRWKCGTCDEWHTGPCLDFSYDRPEYWIEEHEEKNLIAKEFSYDSPERPTTFLDEDYCAIEDRDFFVRGVIDLPIIGTNDNFRWGVWGSLSRESFEMLIRMHDDPKRTELPTMFSWLSTKIPEYPDTLNLKMHANIQDPGWRPFFELEPSDHPLSMEYYQGISPERVKEIMFDRLGLAKR